MKKVLVINNAEPDRREFSGAIEKIVASYGAEFVCMGYADCKNLAYSSYMAIIMSGSPQGDDIVEHHAPYFQWIKTIQKPVLGICAGHHITGYLYGAKLLRGTESESGDHEVELLTADPIFKGLPQKLIVRQMHNDSITLPNGFILLATSETCRNQLMKHYKKPLYTCQFHPEFHNHELIYNFLAICRTVSKPGYGPGTTDKHFPDSTF